MSDKITKIGGLVFCHRTGHPEKFKVFEVVEAPDCNGCAYRGLFGKCRKPRGLFGPCKADKREDGKNVIFRKVRTVNMIRGVQ